MRKMLLFVAAVLCSVPFCSAQYLYGVSNAAGTFPSLVRFDPSNNSFVTILKFFEYYQPSSTKDTTHKIIYFLTPNLSTGDAPDTLVTFKLSDSSVTKKPITKGALSYIEYSNGRLISLSPNGLASFDLATSQYSILDSSIRFTNIHSAAFDHPRGRYICMKRSANNIPDSLFVYTLATRSLQKYGMGISGTSTEMRYSPTSNKVLFLGIPQNTSNYGIYSFNLSTQAFALEGLQTNTGTVVNSATFDENNNRYFCVKVTNSSGTGFNILEYRLNTSTAVDHLVGPPGLAFPQYFDNKHVPAPPTNTSIGTLEEDEPFTMYPNPATNQLTVKVPLQKGMPSIKILDLSGKVVVEQTIASASNSFNISTLPCGSYLLNIIYGNLTYSKLFQKH